jgi:hypothetical protein
MARVNQIAVRLTARTARGNFDACVLGRGARHRVRSLLCSAGAGCTRRAGLHDRASQRASACLRGTAPEQGNRRSNRGFRSTLSTVDVQTTSQASVVGNQISGSANSTGFGTATSRSRFCTVSVVMNGNVVSAVNYAGPTGGLLSRGEQCAYAVEACLPKR